MADVKLRSGYYINLQRLQTTVNGLDESTVTDGEIKASIERAESMWKKIEDSHARLLASTTDEAGITLQEDTLLPMEKCYLEVKSKLYKVQSNVSSFTSSRSTNNTKLPKMPLPQYEGKYEDWPEFQDLFQSLVHKDSSLSGSQKLQYLKSCTDGDAASLIKAFTVTDANYREAWALLDQQYNNSREIIQALVRKLLFQHQIKQESASSLQDLLNITMECIRSLQVLGRPTDKWDDVVCVIVIDKFDSNTKSEWARSLRGTDPPTFKELQDFIIQHIRTLHARGPVKPATITSKGNTQQQQQSRKLNAHHSSVSSCQHCKGTHYLYQCLSLKEMTPERRYAAVKATRVCLNCLRDGHSVKDCQSTTSCKKCDKRHNTFLHYDQQSKSNNSTQSTQKSSSSGSQQTPAVRINTNNISVSTVPTLLKTALVDVVDCNSIKHQVRVFLDDGADGCLIKESIMHQLGLKKQRSNITITGVGGKEAIRSKWKTNIRLHSQIDNTFVDVELYAVPTVTGSINRINSNHSLTWNHIADLRLADPFFHEGGDIDILLGADTVPYILKQGLKQAGRDSPVAQETIFGWVLFGNAASTSDQKEIRIHNTKCEISQALRKFWELEEVSNQPVLTQEETACEQHFIDTHHRQPDGRYVVRLPFNSKRDSLGDSRDQAYKRLMALERRFKRQSHYKQAYVEFMQEYENLNHMEVVTPSFNKPVHAAYLPHHFVLKEDSTTTKQRTVFDGSAKSTTGVSLNDTLMVGATVQPDLFTLLLRFRYNKVALKADIPKMYRQFRVHEDDQDYQRILWREDRKQPVREYKLTTVTYGTASAPFLATRCLNQLAHDEKQRYPLTAEALLTSTYVDDFLGSCETTVKATKPVKELINITAAAGMEIRKWCTNDEKVLQSIPTKLREDCSVFVFDDDSSTSVKALGIKWQPSTDEFMFNVNIDVSAQATKRYLLSEISKTFDPLGWLSPVTILAKLLLQRVWIAGHDWDGLVSSQLQEQWAEYQENLRKLENVRIPRCIIYSTPVQLELHGSCDSSELAYSSSIYLKAIYSDHSNSVHLITSRTRVAPIKCVSLPKLELCGAALLAESLVPVQKSLNMEHTLYCWCDSTIALRWITSHSRRWKTFVANRVSTIQSLTPPEVWHHVRSEDNPADLPSRGISTSELLSSKLWWHGPSWLQQDTYPIIPQQYDEEKVKKEERIKSQLCFHLAKNSSHELLFNAFSSLQKLVRCCAYLIRFVYFIKAKKTSVITGPLTTKELQLSMRKLVEWSQQVSFNEDISHLSKHNRVGSASSLLKLNPFLDFNNIMRVGGRIQHAEVPENTKHPIIIPHNHPLTTLLIRQIHHNHLHSGFTLTNSVVKRDYWILRGRDSIRHFIRKCITCRRAKAKTSEQLMGNLPTNRVTGNRAFLNTGVDFAGPYLVKIKKGRHSRRQGILCNICVLGNKGSSPRSRHEPQQ